MAIGDLLEDRGAGGRAGDPRARGRRCAVALDVTDGASVAAGVAQAAAALGEVDVLVNCAGWDEFRPFLETDEQFWRQVIAINYEGALRTTHAVLGGMIERGWGRIVNVSSDAARVGSASEAVYAGAKAGVIAFTKTIAREAAQQRRHRQRRVPRTDRHGDAERMAPGAPDAERLRRGARARRADAPARAPEDVAAAVAFFACEDAGYITGQTLSVSGGLTMA